MRMLGSSQLVTACVVLTVLTLGSSCGSSGLPGADGGTCAETCTGATPVCDPSTGRCVGCLTTSDCPGATSVCDVSAKTCIEGCESHAQCEAAGIGRPHCSLFRGCLECFEDAHCLDPARPRCVTTPGVCAECARNLDCTDPSRSRCGETDECAPCIADFDCSHLAATPICDEARGTCVECTADTEATRCGANACRPSDGVCTNVPRRSLDRCAVCESDSQCAAGTWCMPQMLDGSPLGYACVPASSSGQCAIDHASLRPFVMPQLGTSIDGAEVHVCQVHREMTCAALRRFNTNCTLDHECTEGTQDAACLSVAGTPNRCTYLCGFDANCPLGFSCSGVAPFCE